MKGEKNWLQAAKMTLSLGLSVKYQVTLHYTSLWPRYTDYYSVRSAGWEEANERKVGRGHVCVHGTRQ